MKEASRAGTYFAKRCGEKKNATGAKLVLAVWFEKKTSKEKPFRSYTNPVKRVLLKKKVRKLST